MFLNIILHLRSFYEIWLKILLKLVHFYSAYSVLTFYLHVLMFVCPSDSDFDFMNVVILVQVWFLEGGTWFRAPPRGSSRDQGAVSEYQPPESQRRRGKGKNINSKSHKKNYFSVSKSLKNSTLLPFNFWKQSFSIIMVGLSGIVSSFCSFKQVRSILIILNFACLFL